jgi:molybdopterin-guanine dinucleotide biosynthesis protein A
MGFDKAFLRLADGRSLLAVLADRFGEAALITDDPAKFDSMEEVRGYRKIKDLHPLAGPVGALRTAIASMDRPKIFVMACDITRLDPSILDALAKRMWERDADITFPRLGKALSPSSPSTAEKPRSRSFRPFPPAAWPSGKYFPW